LGGLGGLGWVGMASLALLCLLHLPPLSALSLPVTSRLRPCAIPHPDPHPDPHPSPLTHPDHSIPYRPTLLPPPSPTLIPISIPISIHPSSIPHPSLIHPSSIPHPSLIHPSSPSLFLVKRSSPAPKGTTERRERESERAREHCSHIFQALKALIETKLYIAPQFIPHIFSIPPSPVCTIISSSRLLLIRFESVGRAYSSHQLPQIHLGP